MGYQTQMPLIFVFLDIKQCCLMTYDLPKRTIDNDNDRNRQNTETTERQIFFIWIQNLSFWKSQKQWEHRVTENKTKIEQDRYWPKPKVYQPHTIIPFMTLFQRSIFYETKQNRSNKNWPLPKLYFLFYLSFFMLSYII